MRSGDYPYPADEFDAAAGTGGPRGAHRAPRSWSSRWLPFLVVLVVFPLLAFGLVTWLSNWDGLPGAAPGQDAAAAGGDGAEEPDAGTGDGGTASPAPTDTPVETPTPTPTPTPTFEVDLGRPVEVFNATSRSGLAAGAAERVQEAGFTEVTTGNWQGTDPDASTVFYAAPEDVATAQAVAASLGLTLVQESAEQAPDGVVVVLVSDYEP